MSGLLRIHFTDRDFRHVQLMRSPDPMWETVLGLHVLSGPARKLPGRLRLWRARAQQQIPEHGLRAASRMINDLAPADASYFPDFLTPIEAAGGLASGLDALRSTSRARIARELEFTARRRALPAWTRRLADRDSRTLNDLAGAVELFHSRLIKPDWSEVEATVEADRARVLDACKEGAAALLGSLRPFTWRDPVLSAPYPMDQSIYLRGRGITFVPSFFCRCNPVAIVDPSLPPVVVYPLRHGDFLPPGRERHDDALEALLGRNRARVLAVLRTTFTTSGVAARLSMSDSSVSVHIKVLRNAGLVESRRVGAHVLHTLTPLGLHVLAP